jgi:LytS/YehU family sensor histidine kinase
VLADAEVGRSEAQASLIAAQLVAAHAQVDPAFVLKRLEDIEQSYAANPEAADAELDELIVFLRDAIPRLRTEDAVPGAA